ncbi:MAG: hypothetical protein U0350_07275 [Caldilineaceae bacterium]
MRVIAFELAVVLLQLGELSAPRPLLLELVQYALTEESRKRR